ncbi:hypothetical protein niasHT_028056 [Heterodera trifolii]|uniref:Alpha-catenin n=1 Tax=Heterodera trifolii TaxID=157864 RepID=A0ABD2KEC9_9BILA
MASSEVTYSLNFDIDEVKTKSVERLIAPMIHLITSLHANRCPSAVNSAVDRNNVISRVKERLDGFIASGTQIIQQHPLANGKVLKKLKEALDAVASSGDQLLSIAVNFVRNPENAALRAQVVEASKVTLLAVVRLLVMADMIDVEILLRQVETVREKLDDVGTANTEKQLVQTYRNLEVELKELIEMTKKRVRDVRDPAMQDDMQAAISVLNATTPIMFASSMAVVSHPELEGLYINRKFAAEEIHRALGCLNDVLQGELPNEDLAISQHGGINQLVLDFDKFQRRVYMEPAEYHQHRHRPQLEELLEQIARGCGFIADQYCVNRQERHGQVIAGVNNLRQALQDLLTEYEKNVGRIEPSEDLDLSKVYLAHKVRDLRRHLRRAVVDHVSDIFLDTKTPLRRLEEAAQKGDFSETQNAAEIFQEHAVNIVEIARLVCDTSSDVDGVRVLRYSALLCEKIAPQVVNAAFLLCEKPESVPMKENMAQFATVWSDRVRVLTMALDALIPLDDFLAVSEVHINEDCRHGIKAIVEDNGLVLDQIAGFIRGRSLRVCDVVLNEMGQLSANPYCENVRRAALHLRNEILPHFTHRAGDIVQRVADQHQSDGERESKRDVDEMIDACQLVHEAVTDIRHAMLMNRNPEDVDSDNEYEEEGTQPADSSSQASASDMENQQQIMRQLPEESKREIQKQIDVFKITQRKFEYEVGKWDETGNDIIALAKKMCQIMMNMTDFTKGRGPYKTTMDVIKAAQEISENGGKLNELARQIGNESVESNTKKDLCAYLERVTLFCHQLNVTSKVKADIQVVGDELRVSGLEAATSLIQNAKNLLNAVILTVKSAYIASTKYRRKENTNPNVVEWRMVAPQKQPLVSASATKAHGVIRRASERRQPPPMQTLKQFHIST